MSEIKGQLLGIIMVLIIFGAVGGVLGALFGESTNKIIDKSENLTKPFEDAVTGSADLLSYNG